MNSNLIIFEKEYGSKNHFTNLKSKFEFYLTLEKILREIYIINDIEDFLDIIFEFLKFYHNDLEFYVEIENKIIVNTLEERKSDIQVIFSNKINILGKENGLFKVLADNSLEFDQKIFHNILSHIELYYIFNKYGDYYKNTSEDYIDLSYKDIEKKYNIVVQILNSVSENLKKDIKAENIYTFLKLENDYKYLFNYLNKKVDFNSTENNDLLENYFKDCLKKRFSFSEFKGEDKLVLSNVLGCNVKNLIFLPIRTMEEVVGIVVIVNIEEVYFEIEKILDLYNVYFQKCLNGFKNTFIYKKQNGILKMYSIVADIIEQTSIDSSNDKLDDFFKNFKDYFSLSEAGLFYLKNNKIYNCYSSSSDIENLIENIDFQEKSGILTYKNAIYYYKHFSFHNEFKGLLVFKPKGKINKSSEIMIQHIGLLIFNVIFNESMSNEIKELDKFAVIGKMAQEMAHEIRNPLGGIKLYIELLRKKISDNDEIFENLNTGLENIETVIREMLDFTKNTVLNKININVEELLNNSIKMIPDIKDVNIEKEVFENFELNIDKEKIIRVLLNIIKNALQALVKNNEDKTIRFSIYKSGNNGIIEIWNSGGEISEKIKGKIFDPFFTTKRNGNGLGLSICKKIMRAHNGDIKVVTRNGWTGFKLIF